MGQGRGGRSTGEAAGLRYRLILVHGTWARGAKWIEPGSETVKGVVAQLHAPAATVAMRWSGRNTFSARRQASEMLGKEIQEQASRHPNDKIFVIAHSHGGNVAMQAIQNGDVRDKISGLVCLSTPFFHVRPRPMAYWFALTHLIIMFVSIPALLTAVLYYSGIGNGIGLVCSAVIGLVFWCVGLLSIAVFITSKTDRLAHSLGHPFVHTVPTLCIRAAGDEASLLLATFQLIGWVTGRPIALGELEWKESSERLQAVGRLLFRLTIFGGGALLVASLISRYTGQKIFGITAILIGLAVGAILSRFLPIARYPLAVLMAVFTLPFYLLLSVFALPFGWELSAACWFYDVTVEAAPPGLAACYHIEDDLTRARSGGLMHSETWNDSRASELAGLWIRQQMDSPSSLDSLRWKMTDRRL
jgi:hypothetical protein